MPALGRQGDVAGGAVTATQGTVRCNGIPVIRIGDPVARHGDDEHAAPVMDVGSLTVRVGGIGVCRMGDAATCGHTLGAASPSVNAG